LLRLGWSHRDEEIISRANAVAWFDLNRVGKAPARFDMDKLADINSHYLRAMDDAELWDLVSPLVTPTSSHAKDRVTKLMPLLKERAKTHQDIAAAAGFLVHDGAPEIQEDAAGLLDENAVANLGRLLGDLPEGPWEVEALQAFIKNWLAENGLKMKDIGLPLRAALTGTKQSPSIVDVMAALGPEEAADRIQKTCKI
ncbi:MAG: glutamate--tRNA ligase, partial [Alphaproteobacteria bacterium]